ncbi:MAG TPA: GNAT family N-acetyltransferase [Cytophagales bacterium]|nr:GNAT family N-acetyltransferase [Cytophagales bacterium]
MTTSVSIELARTDEDLEQILNLQKINHVENLTSLEKEVNGFVTVKHDIELLTKMNNTAPQIIAKENDTVVGYALVMFEEFGEMIPVLTPMFDMINQLNYNGKPLATYSYYVMGQICISEAFRGQGIFEKLYLKHKEIYSGKFEFCLTEVSVRNTRSMKAHEKMGFRTIHTFRDKTDEWNILLWDWQTR